MLIKRMSLGMLAVLAALLVGCAANNTGSGTPTTDGEGSGNKDAMAKEVDPEVIKLALLPDENASTLIKENEGFRLYLEETIGKKVELVPMTDYATLIKAMEHGQLHIAFFGPLSYVKAAETAPIEPFAARMKNGKTTYHSVVIASTASGIEKIEDIKGKKMAYGDKLSTSSHMIPKKLLLEGGLMPGADYEQVFLGAHDAVARNVAEGNADAGGLSEKIFMSLVEEGKIDKTKVKLIKKSNPWPEYPWALRTDLKPELKEKIKNAFYELKDEEILKKLKKSHGFAKMTDDDYKIIRDTMAMLKEKGITDFD